MRVEIGSPVGSTTEGILFGRTVDRVLGVHLAAKSLDLLLSNVNEIVNLVQEVLEEKGT